MERILKLILITMLLLVDEPQGICAENTYKNIYTYTCVSQRSDSDITSDTNVNVESVRYTRRVCDRSVFGVSVNPVYNDRLNCSVDDNNDVVTFCFYNITAEDSGKYIVDFINTRKDVTVYVMDKPTLPTISPSSATEGQTVTLTCVSSSTSTPSPTGQPITYTWTVDGATPADSRYSVSGKRLTIQNVQKGDKDRMFQCVAKETNGLSSERRDITLNVQYHPIVSISPSTVSPVEGQTNLRLTCTVTEAKPSSITRYRWYKEGAPSNILFTQQTYIITTVTRGHAGVYHCQAENSVGWSVQSASVTVNVLFRPIVSISPSAQTPNEGQTDLRLTCTTEEANPSSITGYRWYKEGAPSNILSTQQTYTITTVTRGHAGVYHCQAENIVGWSTSPASTQINVLYKPSVVLNSTQPSLVAQEGDQGFSVSCKVTDSNPREVTYRWSKQGVTVSNSSTYVFTAIRKTYDGTYLCTASNSVGTSVAVAVEVKVLYPCLISDIKSKGSNVYEGSNILLTCDTEGNPFPTLKWVNMENQTILHTENNTLASSFNVPVSRCTDTGNYTCLAYNGVGSAARESIYLDIYCAPRFIKRENSGAEIVRLRLGQTMILSVPFVSNPTPSIKWLYKRTATDEPSPVLFSTGETQSSGVTYVTNLQKDILSRDEFGIYVITILNSYGTTSFSFTTTESISNDDAATSGSHMESSSIAFFVVGAVLCIVAVVVFIVIFLSQRRRQRAENGIQTKDDTGNVYDDLKQSDIPQTDQPYDDLQMSRIQVTNDMVSDMNTSESRDRRIGVTNVSADIYINEDLE